MPNKRAILATAHKLLRTTAAMLRDNRPDIDPDIDYDKLLVDRNAAHWLRKLDEHTAICRASVSARSRQRPEPDAILPHIRPRRGAGADTDRGYRGGLAIRRLVGRQWLPAELRDRGLAPEVCLQRDNVSQ